MAYKLIITEHADELLDNLMYYLLYRLKSEQAAQHLLDEIEKVYARLEKNPLQFPLSKNTYLASKGYHEAVVPQMDYIVIFNIKANAVNVVGVFHQLGIIKKRYKRDIIDLQNINTPKNVVFGVFLLSVKHHYRSPDFHHIV